MQAERRKHRRFKVNDNAFAVINPDPVKLVPILDIGMGGIGIYVDDGAKWMNDSPKLEIMMADCSFYLDNLSFEIIAKFRAFPEDASNILDGRRYSLKFGNLRPAQKSRLKYFIRNYTRGGSKLQILRRLSKLLHPTWTNKYAEQSCNLGIWQGLH
jgi:c-di-GMP-binding flagellar brake protein YcgR